MITEQQCVDQAVALRAAADASPVRQISGPLRRAAKEWDRAAQDLAEAIAAGEDPEVALAGSLPAGVNLMRDGFRFWLIRSLVQGGQLSLHVQDDETGRQEYVNLASGVASPVVLIR